MEYLKEKNIQVDIEEGSFKVNRESCLDFFRKDYEQFMKALDDLKNTTLETFAGYVPNVNGEITKEEGKCFDFSSKLYDLTTAHEDECGFWIWWNGIKADGTRESFCDELYTLDEFMRLLKYETNNDKEYTTFYIGNTVNYHF